jgi:hypothetical protein
MNRHSRRLDQSRLAALARANEATIAADARFFERFPDRNHRIRVASRPEVDLLRHQTGGVHKPLGTSVYAIVKQIRPGWRLRACVILESGFDTDQPEDECRRIYDDAARPRTQAHEIERQFAREAEGGR